MSEGSNIRRLKDAKGTMGGTTKPGANELPSVSEVYSRCPYCGMGLTKKMSFNLHLQLVPDCRAAHAAKDGE